MNETEYLQWRINAASMLLMTGTYTKSEISYIVEWFDTIKTRKEIDLLGGDEEEAYELFNALGNLNSYNLSCVEMVARSMYARLFLYAPYIRKQYLTEKERS